MDNEDTLAQRLKELHDDRNQAHEDDMIQTARTALGVDVLSSGADLKGTLSNTAQVLAQDHWQKALAMVAEEAREQDALRSMRNDPESNQVSAKVDSLEGMVEARFIAEQEAKLRKEAPRVPEPACASPNRWDVCKAAAMAAGSLESATQLGGAGQSSAPGHPASVQSSQLGPYRVGLSIQCEKGRPAKSRLDSFDIGLASSTISADTRELEAIAKNRLERWSKRKSVYAPPAGPAQSTAPTVRMTAGARFKDPMALDLTRAA